MTDVRVSVSEFDMRYEFILNNSVKYLSNKFNCRKNRIFNSDKIFNFVII